MTASSQVMLADLKHIESIIESNNSIKKSTLTLVKEFLEVQENFLGEVDQVYKNLATIEHVAEIFLDETKKKILQEFNPLEHVQLAVSGYNSVGKTSFIHELLGCGEFLPVEKGAVTARIVKFSYAPQESACLIRYTSVQDLTEIDDRIDLSAHFKNGVSSKTRSKGLRKVVKEHVGRPEGIDQQSDEFSKWAKIFVEIRLPSDHLKPGLHVYDTPGFLGSDPRILRENLLTLVGSVHPTIVFLYDNPTGSDDSRKCYNELKVALCSEQMGVDIFFLNTKADVAIMRKDASNNDDDEDDDDEKLIDKERSHRYELLMKIDEMKGDVHERNLGEMGPSFDQCNSFDMFTTASPLDPMEITIKSHAINRIIHFAAEHDLRLTKYVINIVHEAIDAFFDFVLVTNRRSTDEWNKLRDDALQWGKTFFEQYRSAIHAIAKEANLRLPKRFQEKRLDIEKKAIDDCETRGIHWDDRLSLPRLQYELAKIRHLIQSVKNISRDYRNDEQTFIDILMEREVTKPVLLEIISQESNNIKQQMSKDHTCHRSKNELLYAAYREVLIEIGNFGNINQLSVEHIIYKAIAAIFLSPVLLSFFMVYGVPFGLLYLARKGCTDKRLQDAVDRRKQSIRHYLVDLEAAMSKMGDQVKINMLEWIDQEHKKYEKKVNGYHRVVCRTIQDRQKAYELARLFVSKFIRIECHLEANLNLAAHHGSRPIVIHDEVLGTGGFFTVHPSSWDNEHGLVAKKLREHINDQNFTYLEAHFHRTVTKLDIPHLIQLKYLYVDEKASMYLLLPRYPTNLHSFLLKNIRTMTTPIVIHDEVLGTGGFFTVHPSSWDNEHGLVVKKLREHINDQNFTYLEAHFHRTVTKLDIPHLIQLKYLYVDEKASMYLLLPRYPTNLHSFLLKNIRTMTTDKAIKISRDIAGVIAHMHAFDLVHRDIKVENILMDEHEEVYLADFGTCQHGTENSTLVGSFPLAPDLTASNSSSDRQYSYEGTAVDVYLLGVLMFVCAPKDVYIPPSNRILDQVHQLDRKKIPENYCALIVRCLEKNPKLRPTAQAIADELDAMTERLCIVCMDALRSVRFQPCGHKVVCVQCLAQIQQTKVSSQCILCNQVIASAQEDNNTNTFFVPSSN
ncbi:unnamed protein product [Rotaria socialis]|uniref:Uncharacterized protein n=1 Tax=Rotaria socialis TaxID=392032 RepID=A0A817WJZ0_9BILA|nr:unnamed protein product [Rotaria socialis]CAF4309336.1 unnamed protein product [Rotaria socialis]